MYSDKLYGEGKRNESFGRNGFASSVLVLAIIISFLVGAASGMVIYSEIQEAESGGVIDNGSTAGLEERIAGLENKIDTLQESLGGADVWNAAQVYQDIRPSTVNIRVRTGEEGLTGSTFAQGTGLSTVSSKISAMF